MAPFLPFLINALLLFLFLKYSKSSSNLEFIQEEHKLSVSSPTKILEDWNRHTNFSIEIFESYRSIYVNYKGTIQFSTHPLVSAESICDYLINENFELEGALLRCVIALVNSIKIRKVAAVNQLITLSDAYSVFPYDGEIWSILSAFDDSIVDIDEDDTNDGCMCILGEIDVHVIVSLIASNHTSRKIIVFYFSDYFASSQLKLIHQLAALLEKELVFIDGFSLLSESILHAFKGYCSQIFISPNLRLEHLPNAEIKPLVITLGKREEKENRRDEILIYWLSFHSPSQKFEDLFDWYTSSSWDRIFLLSESIDKNGFVAKKYEFAEPTIHENLRKEFSSLFVGKLVTNDIPVIEQSTAGKRLHGDTIYIAISYTTRLFADSALALRNVLADILLNDTVEVIPSPSPGFFSKLLKIYGFKNRILHIAVGPHDLTELWMNYIVFHMEQSWCSLIDWPNLAYEGRSRYSYVLSNALAIWTFSEAQRDYFQSKAFPDVSIIPIFSLVKHLNQVSAEKKTTFAAGDTTMLFFGSCSSRRIKALEIIVLGLEAINREHTEINFIIYCSQWENILDEFKRDEVVIRSQLALNICNEDDSVLEVHRINYLLSLGSCVLSERGKDTELADKYSSAVIFYDRIEDIVPLALSLKNNKTAIDNCQKKSLALFRSINSDVETLRLSLYKIRNKMMLSAET